MLERVLNGDRRALARLLTLIENDDPQAAALLRGLYPHTGRAHLIGVTGAPGTGKSTLVTALAKAYRADGHTVGIIAVDPTSPFSGGAILGDRVRMRDLSGDAGVFIRSMATRGSLGGLARTTCDAARALDAAGYAVIIIETVGAGQNEVEIARLAQTTLVVEAPGLGDDVQAIKAGILEIADVLVVNKADRPGVENTVRALRAMLELGHPAAREQIADALHHRAAANGAPAPDSSTWIPPIVQTVAAEGKGIEDVVAAVAAHRQFVREYGLSARLERRQIELEVMSRLRDRLLARLLTALPADALDGLVEQVQTRTLDPGTAVERLLMQIETPIR
jgi:LAO/AO transport system kinase